MTHINDQDFSGIPGQPLVGVEIIIALSTNAASTSAHWPGPLDIVRQHPWWSILTFGIVALVLTFLTAVITNDGNRVATIEQLLESEERLSDRIETASGTYPTDINELIILLKRQSDSRRRRRLAPFDLEADIDNVIDSITSQNIPQINRGGLVTLIGAFGAGKSEIAEQWHITQIDRLEVDKTSSIPLWISARELSNASLDELILRRLGVVRARAGHITFVIDGLDETDGATAEVIVGGCRDYIAGNPQAAGLITCRPGVLGSSEDDVLVNGLSEDAARDLIDHISQRRFSTYQWDRGLIESIRRPFFALAAGAVIAAGKAPSGQAEVVGQLAERALAKGRTLSNPSFTKHFEILTRLASSLTDSNGIDDGLSFRERQIALSTTLTTQTASKTVQFSLPIFEQWFSAQSLISNVYSIERAISDPSLFDRWRWAISIAILNGQGAFPRYAVEVCLRANPGIGSWILDQVSHGGVYWTAKEQPDLNQETAQAELLSAARVWIDSLGGIAPKFLPVTSASSPFRLGVRVHKRQMFLGWTTPNTSTDVVEILPEETRPFPPYTNEWRPLLLGQVEHGNMWPWLYFKDVVSRNMLRVLNNAEDLGSPSGLWRIEYWYMLARHLYRSMPADRAPLDRDETIRRIDQLLGATVPDGSAFAGFQLNGLSTRRQTLSELRTWLLNLSSDQFESPVPGPDQPFTGWVWSGYSAQRATKFCAEVLGLACDIYDDLTATDFASFDWTLGSHAIGRFGILGTLTIPTGNEFHDAHQVDYIQVPMELISNYQTEKSVTSKNNRCIILSDSQSNEWLSNDGILSGYAAEIHSWASAGRIRGPFWSLPQHGPIVDYSSKRPASNAAAKWIFDDLKRLSLASGTFPQL